MELGETVDAFLHRFDVHIKKHVALDEKGEIFDLPAVREFIYDKVNYVRNHPNAKKWKALKNEFRRTWLLSYFDERLANKRPRLQELGKLYDQITAAVEKKETVSKSIKVAPDEYEKVVDLHINTRVGILREFRQETEPDLIGLINFDLSSLSDEQLKRLEDGQTSSKYLQIRAAATLERRRRSKKPKSSPFLASHLESVWQPESEPQRLALESDADELLYGGQAGGGKTDLLLGCAICNHQRSIIFRREYPQAEAIMDRSEELLSDIGKWNGVQHRWRVGERQIIRIGAMQKPKDWRKWRGQPFDFIGFDEGAEFIKEQFQSLIAWNRSVDPNQRCRVIVASNPPSSAEGDWVIDYWASWLDEEHSDYPARPGELRYFATIDGEQVEVQSSEPIEHNGSRRGFPRSAGTRSGETIYPRSRTFIPASLDDNPYLRNDTQYRSGLQNLPEPLRSQLLLGDFTVSREPDAWQVIPTAWVKLAQARWKDMAKPMTPMTALGVDPARGGKDQTVIAPRYGNWFAELKKYAGTQTPSGDKVAELVMAARLGSKAMVNIDVIGIGASPYDTLKRAKVRVNAINFAEKSDATDRTGELTFANVRAEAYWKFRETLNPETGDEIALPPDSELLRDLCAPRWRITARGIMIESKDDLIKRLGRSTDCGDAVVMAHLTPKRSYLGIVAQGKAKGW